LRTCQSGAELGARDDGLEEALFDKAIDDARSALEALARDVDDEDAAVKDVGEVGVVGGVRAECIFKVGIDEAGERVLDCAVDADDTSRIALERSNTA